MGMGGARCDERLSFAVIHFQPSNLDGSRFWPWGKTFPRHELNVVACPACMKLYLLRSWILSCSCFIFPLTSLILPSFSHPFRRLNSFFQISNFKFQFSHLRCLNRGQVTYKTGSVVPKVVDVPKWVMPTEMYSARPSTVLAYKKAHQVGRFDPAAPEILEQKIAQMWREIEERGSLDLPRSHHA